MRHIKISNIILFVIILFSLFSCNNEKEINSIKGFIDLSSHKFQKNKIVSLNGEWEFYYGKLLEPKDFINANNKPSYIEVPKSWNMQKGNKYPELGCATYRLKIRMPKDSISLVIENNRIFTSYKIWLNGKLIKQVGKVAHEEKDYAPKLSMCFIERVYFNKENEIIIQTANFKDPKSGIIAPVRIGEYKYFHEKKIIDMAFFVGALSIIFIIGLYHFVIFMYNRKEYSSLLFSVLAFMVILFGLATHDSFLKNFLNLSYNSITKITYFVIATYPPLMTGFFYFLFKKEVSKKILIIVSVISVVLLSFDMLADVYYARKFVFLNLINITFVQLYFICYSLPKAIKNNKKGAAWALTGMSALFITSMNDTLFVLGHLNTAFLSHYGFTLYVIFQSINIAERYSFSFKNNLNLSKMLKVQNKKLRIAKKEAEKADKLKSAFLANMSHEIRTPINAVLGFAQLLDCEEITNKQRLEYVKMINSGGTTLLHLINDIIDISKIESNQLEIIKEETNINSILNEIYDTFRNSKRVYDKEKIEFRLILPDVPAQLIVVDEMRLKQVFNNLLSNSFKFTKTGSIEFGYTKEIIKQAPYFQFYVRDTGIGIPPHELENIFNRFRKLEHDAKNIYRGTGLGLAITKNIVEICGGEIWVESKQRVGSEFYFTLPDYKYKEIRTY